MTLDLALQEWQRGVKEPSRTDPSPEAQVARAAIYSYIKEGLHWDGWIKTYSGDGAFAWCGAFAAYCMPWVRKELRYKWFASTYRLSEYGRKNPKRLVNKFDDISPGDIVCVGSGNYGSHITRAVCWDKNKAELVTVSGNGNGRLHDGSWGEGVVMNVYSRHEVRAAYRPLPEDM